MSKIFDLDNVEGLPPELLKELKSVPSGAVLGLFKVAQRELNISELLLGYYRKYGEVRSRSWMVAQTYKLAKQNKVEPTGKKGEYRLKTMTSGGTPQ